MEPWTNVSRSHHPPRISTARGGGTPPGNGSGRQTAAKWSEMQGAESQGSEGREEGSARLQLCQQMMLWECSPARAGGHQEQGAAVPEQIQGQASAQQHRPAPAHSLPIHRRGHHFQGEFPIWGLSVLTIPSGKTVGA